ncbi:MAG: hypothetical protein J7577_01010 [Sphingobacteriaceae bacterium]|nr:hypothetical protein [Sphingobacteriaceae bacterium]
MAKLQLNGFLEEVGGIHFVGTSGTTAKQLIVVRVPAWTNQFGEKQGEDELWQISLIGTAVDKFNIHNNRVGAKVKTEVYIRSNQYQSKKDQSIGYMVNINLASIEFLSPGQKPASNEIPAEYYEQRAAEITPDQPKEDLPF